MAWEMILFLMACSVVSAGCLLPAGWLPPLPNDKLLHFVAFGGLTLIALRIAQDWSEMRYWLAGLALAGWLIEVLQNLVPGRSFCWRDLGANVAGILAASCCAPLLLAH